MDNKKKYTGLKNIIKDLDKQNEDLTDDRSKDDESDVVSKTSRTVHLGNNYAEYMLENNDISIFGCYLDYQKAGQKCVLMIYKDPSGIEKIIVASLDMENDFELIEKAIADLGLDTDLVTVMGGGKLTIENEQVNITDNDKDSLIGNIDPEGKNSCTSIIKQHLYGHGIENIHYAVNEQILETFNEQLDKKTKSQIILILIQKILESNEMLYRTSDKKKIEILQKKIKRHRNVLKQYHESFKKDIIKDFPTRRDYIKDMESLMESSIYYDGLSIPLSNKNAFMQFVNKYGTDLTFLCYEGEDLIQSTLKKKSIDL